MQIKEMTHIGFLLENCEEIWFNTDHVMEFEAEIGTEHLMKIQDEFVQFKTIDWLDMTVAAQANHTYNSFGKASEVTNFNRLLDEQEVVAVMIHAADEEVKRYYCEDDILTSISLDLEGNLAIVLVHEDDVMDEPCDCECECECCCEETELEF